MLRIMIFAFSFIAASAQASVIALFTERSTDVLLTVSGSIDLNDLGGTSSTADFVLGTSLSGGGFRVGPPTGTVGDSTTYFLGDFYQPFVSGTSAFGSFLGGDLFVVADNGASDQIRLIASYVSGSSLFGQGSFAGSFASLGINAANDVVMNLSPNQTITVSFDRESSISAPTTLALFSLGLAGLGWSRRKA